MKNYKSYYVTVFFLLLSLIAIYFSRVSGNFILGELYSRFIRNGMFLLALIVPIMAGMGINFSITIGAMAAQIALVMVIDMKVEGVLGFLVAILLSIFFAWIFGNIIGILLNKAKGKEMIASIVIGFLGTNIFQLVFMVGYGTLIKPLDQDILLARGIGVKSMLDASFLKKLYVNLLPVKIGDVYGSLIPIFMVLAVGAFVYIISRSKLGSHIRAVGTDLTLSEKLGIDVDKVRRKAIVISTVLAALSQLMFIQDLGILNVYTGHLNIDVFSAAALLVGGATLKKANIKNAFLGLILFHTLFIVSPIAGQNIFQNASLGEYFRSFIAYGTIVFALVMNLKYENQRI